MVAVVSLVGTSIKDDDAPPLPIEDWLNTCVTNTCAPSYMDCSITEDIDFGMVLAPTTAVLPDDATCPENTEPAIPRISSLPGPSDRITCVTSGLSVAFLGVANTDMTFSHRRTFTTMWLSKLGVEISRNFRRWHR